MQPIGCTHEGGPFASPNSFFSPFFPLSFLFFPFLSSLFLTTVSPGVQASNCLFPRYLFTALNSLLNKKKNIILPPFFQAHWLPCCVLIQPSSQPSLVLKTANVAAYPPCLKEGVLLPPGSLQNQSQPALHALLEGRESSGTRSRNHIPRPLSAAQSSAAPAPFKAPRRWRRSADTQGGPACAPPRLRCPGAASGSAPGTLSAQHWAQRDYSWK